jgi:hypothetical protein
MNPAEELRAAATGLRERVALVPLNWHLTGSQVVAVGTDALAGTDVIASCMVPARAAYVAGMHPGVALAIADWLDKIAWMVKLDPEMLGRVGCDEAIATAREFLGTEANPAGDQ